MAHVAKVLSNVADVASPAAPLTGMDDARPRLGSVNELYGRSVRSSEGNARPLPTPLSHTHWHCVAYQPLVCSWRAALEVLRMHDGFKLDS